MNGMRPRLVLFGLVLPVILGAGNAPGMEYFVAMDGLDTSPGTREDPFRTIQHAADLMQPGDICTVQGGTYRETVRPAASGEGDKPIVFRTFDDEAVVVSGADPLEGWQAEAGGRFTAAGDWDFGQLFVDGAMMREARWPNAAPGGVWPVWANAEEGSDVTGIVDAALPPVDLEGAQIHVLPGRRWVSWTRPVQGLEENDQSKKVLFDGSWQQNDAYRIGQGSQYYLFRAPALLDAPGEWYLDLTAGEVTLIPPSGAGIEGHRVEAKHRDLAFDLRDRRHITVEGFRIFAATIHLGGGEDCLVRDCHLRYASHFTEAEGWTIPASGIVLGGRNNTVRDSSVLYSAGNGVTLDGENNTVSNCLIQYVDYMATDCGAVFARGRGNVIEGNTLRDAGRSVLLHRTLKAGRIERNDIFNAGILTTDLGSTYCYDTDGEGTVIAYNWVHDNQAAHVGVGIYIDNGSKNFIIHHNVSWNNPDSAIRLNTPSNDNFVYNNTVLDNGNSLSYWGPNGMKDQSGCRVANNIFTDEVQTGDGLQVDHNYEGTSPGIVSKETQDFRLAVDSPCIDAGTPIEGITTDTVGSAPDIGAYEQGAPPWKPGHDWGKPPEF